MSLHVLLSKYCVVYGLHFQSKFFPVTFILSLISAMSGGRDQLTVPLCSVFYKRGCWVHSYWLKCQWNQEGGFGIWRVCFRLHRGCEVWRHLCPQLLPCDFFCLCSFSLLTFSSIWIHFSVTILHRALGYSEKVNQEGGGPHVRGRLPVLKGVLKGWTWLRFSESSSSSRMPESDTDSWWPLSVF